MYKVGIYEFLLTNGCEDLIFWRSIYSKFKFTKFFDECS